MQLSLPAKMLRSSMAAMALGMVALASQAGTLTQTGNFGDNNLRLNNFSGGSSYSS